MNIERMRSLRLLALFLVLVSFRTLRAEGYEQCLERALKGSNYSEAVGCLRPALASSPKSYKINYDLADVFQRMGQLDSAFAYGRRAIELKENFVNALQLLGSVCLAQHNPADAATWYAKAQREEGRTPSYTTAFGLGRSYTALDSFKVATLWLSRAAEIDTSQSEPHIVLGDYYAGKQVYILAQEQFELAIIHKPRSIPWRMKLAKAYFDNSQYDSAVKVYERITDIEPDNVDALSHLGDIYVQARQWHNAFIMYDHLGKLKPEDGEFHWFAGFTAFKSRSYVEGIVHFEWILKQGKKDSIGIEAARMLALSYLSQKDGLNAVRAFEALKNIDSTKLVADDYRRLGSAYLESKDTAKAFAAFEQFTVLDSTDCEVCKLIGPRKMVLRDYAGAVTFFKLRLRRCDTVISVFKNIGLCYEVLQNSDSAAVWYRMVLARKPNDGWAIQHLGLLYFRQEQRDSALELFEQFIRTASPDSVSQAELADANKYAGVILLIKKNFSGALEYLKKAQVTLKDDCDVLLWLAQCYHNLQQKDDATRYYSLVIQKNCKNAKTAREGMKLLESK
jgi:tetratricopeptide (TPR) repeat protein